MKKGFHTIFLTIIWVLSHAQTYHAFPETESVWTLMDAYSTTTYYISYVIQIGDTNIGQNTYHKLYKEPYISYPFSDTGYIGAIRQNPDLEQVYIFLAGDTVERLLYDFSSDTINAPFPNTIQRFDSSATIFSLLKLNWGFVGTDSTISFYYRDPADTCFSGDFVPAVAEGIGSIRGGLLSKVGLFPAPGQSDSFIVEYIKCLYIGDTLIYNMSGQNSAPYCASPLTVDITELKGGFHITVTPNPISDLILISCNDLPLEHNYSFKIYNTLGEEITNQNISPLGTSIYCLSWLDGLYIWLINDESGLKVAQGKLVKE